MLGEMTGSYASPAAPIHLACSGVDCRGGNHPAALRPPPDSRGRRGVSGVAGHLRARPGPGPHQPV